jgi:pimeloyl-ACP methyl ester carboxylesterase
MRQVILDPRQQLLAGAPVAQRTLELAGISTAVLEGGNGPPLVLLHGPAAHAVEWAPHFPDLVSRWSVVAPDLPGHGSTDIPSEVPDADRVLRWLGELIARTCPVPPAVVGHTLGGAIAARFAAEQGDRIARLVLVDTFGLAPFQPAPEFASALAGFVADPNEATYERLWSRCAYDLDRLRARMGERWDTLRTYTLDRVRAPGAEAVQGALMEQFGFPAIAPETLARIAVPTSLIWGRQDLATSLTVAEAASVRYGWPLHVIDDAADDPRMEQPERFLDAMRMALGR